MASEEVEKQSGTYEAGCHCGYIKFAFTLSPPLSETKVLECNCSACSHLGYLLVYPAGKDVQWHGDSLARLARYQFNTKRKDQMFCPKCGSSLGIDFREFFAKHRYGINIRSLYGVDLTTLQYKKLDGVHVVEPDEDLAGKSWDEEKGEMK